MSITIKQAFANWSLAPRNTVMSARYRDGVQKILMKKYSDTELSNVTKDFARNIISQSSESHQLKVQAASVLVFLLQWGCDHGHCERPAFTYSEIIPEEKQKSLKPPVYTAVLNRPTGDQLKAPSDIYDNKHETSEPDQTNNEESGYETKRGYRGGGRPPRAVIQIDPDTLKIVKEWPVMAYVDAALGIGKGNVSRAVKKHQKAAGFFWCYAEESDKYIKALKKKYPSRKNIDVIKKQYETFNEMRNVGSLNELSENGRNILVAEDKQETKPGKINSPSSCQAQDAPSPEIETAVTRMIADQAVDFENVDRQNIVHQHEQTAYHDQPKPSDTKTEKKSSTVNSSLSVFTDRELIDELEHRGWVGCFSRTEIVTIGK